MLKAYSAAYGMVVANITTLMVSSSIARSSGDDLLAIGITSSKDLEDIRWALGQPPESALLRRKIDRIIERVESHSVTGNDILVLATEFRDDFFSEMGRYLFLAVPAERREFFEQQQPVFGEEFSRQFPELVSDASAAARCLAVDEWTAAVFHLMRVLEGGIYDVALTLGIAFKRGEKEQWRNAIDQIEGAIRDMDKIPQSPRKSEDLKYYAQAASHFRWFKDAWRNHVTHSRTHYDERQALQVWANVRPFMQELAERKAATE